MDFNPVEDGLFLGSRRGLQDFLLSHTSSTVKVLTIESDDLSQIPSGVLEHKFIQVDDLVTADLLSHFDDIVSFIKTGLLTCAVYVHCRHGVSRSATACAAYLMAKHGISADDAVKRLRHCRPCVSPNAGFRRQLELYERLGCRTSLEQPEFRRYRLRAAAQAAGMDISRLTTLSEPLLVADAGLPGAAGPPAAVYRCRQCRTALFSEHSVVKEQEKAPGVTAGCIRLLPLPWMTTALCQPRGRLSCPRCSHKLGSFSWLPDSGLPEEDFEPSFLITRSRVDHCPPRVAALCIAQRPLAEKPRTIVANGSR
ncbi:dual specificity protein phosphatase MPK-4-like isoform X1 [Amphibalanus amphitrite]|uniref:dual specificity protein phosphatase MPK-4-like isoform X1 n=2 Tax=Amphibalanus amphitrite TaxID=1232801 RepID=UPI001C904228|nr:dual specificity protein phosphatase MPK-4-like isoform X1 [Amphibalanus amphitrite]XP_043200994.1 dual specificity protein phosphatase MPK-4-like isoform X1 [Amphibalanus amphitrite]XP_043200995.1 dual specificity protein phosphatase MPK-4-like isoform X1 [Amphibalanus amphitrite]